MELGHTSDPSLLAIYGNSAWLVLYGDLLVYITS